MSTRLSATAFIALALLSIQASAQLASTPDAEAELRMADTCFAELKAACARPEANLWGRSLFGPMMLIDAESRRVFANRLDDQGLLHPYDKLVDTGRLAPGVTVANTATVWGGVYWATVMFPVNTTTSKRMRLFLHESFHRIQDSLGLPANSPMCNHLDSKDGRIWFRLELAALKQAVAKPAGQRQSALKAALLFRECRYVEFKGARDLEHGLEWNEGLAEFTGVYASRIWETNPDYLAGTVDLDTVNYPSFTRSAAYLTGPLYGILLSEKAPGWQRKITEADNFGDLVRKAYGLSAPPTDSGSVLSLARMIMGQFDGDAIVAQETARDDRHQVVVRKYRAALVDGPVLALPFKHVQVQFDPRNLISLDSNGTVYPGIMIRDDWGELDASDAALIDSKWGGATVSFSSNMTRSESGGSTTLETPAWKLKLAPGWKLVPGQRQGDVKLSKD